MKALASWKLFLPRPSGRYAAAPLMKIMRGNKQGSVPWWTVGKVPIPMENNYFSNKGMIITPR